MFAPHCLTITFADTTTDATYPRPRLRDRLPRFVSQRSCAERPFLVYEREHSSPLRGSTSRLVSGPLDFRVHLGTCAHSEPFVLNGGHTASLNGRYRTQFSLMDCRESIGYALMKASRGNSSGAYPPSPTSSFPLYCPTQNKRLDWETVKDGFG